MPQSASTASAPDDDFPLSRRHLLTMISAIMALTAVAIDLMLPAFDEIRETYGLRDGSADTGRVVTYFFFGLAAAHLVYGPLADRFGRKPVFYLGISIYVVGAVGSALRGFVEVARTPVTAGYTVASVFLQGVFTVYLATSEAIISDIFGRRDQFPIIFGVVAMGFGITALANGRLVHRFGVNRVVSVALACILPLSLVLVVETLGAEQPSFWMFMPTLACVLSAFMFLLPNLNSAAMEPVGHLAGTASALTGAARVAGGAALGTVISSQITDSVRPFAIGIAGMCFACGAAVLVVRMGEHRRERVVSVPVEDTHPAVLARPR